MNSNDKSTKRSITTTDKTNSAGSTKVFDPQLQSFTKRALRFQSFTNKECFKQQKLSIDRIIEKILFALGHFYEQDTTGFYVNCKEFLTKSWESWKLKIVDRINTYEYLQMAIRHKSYSQIEVEILKQWKKNFLLFGIMTYWYNSMQNNRQKIKTIQEFKNMYTSFRQFISQISYQIFKGWFTNLEKKKISVLDKLFEETSHFIITEASEFKKVYDKVLLPLIQCQNRPQRINWEFDLDTLQMKKCIYNEKKQQNMPRTIEALKKFSKQVRLSKKTQLLRQFRVTLEQELIANQKFLIEQHEVKGAEILQKDDFISTIIYCIVNGEVQDIQSSMKYIMILLGENMQLLSKLQVNSYAIDIIAGVEYLTDQNHESELILHQNHVFDKRLKIQSSPLIEHGEFEPYLKQTSLTTKLITSIDETSADGF